MTISKDNVNEESQQPSTATGLSPSGSVPSRRVTLSDKEKSCRDASPGAATGRTTRPALSVNSNTSRSTFVFPMRSLFQTGSGYSSGRSGGRSYGSGESTSGYDTEDPLSAASARPSARVSISEGRKPALVPTIHVDDQPNGLFALSTIHEMMSNIDGRPGNRYATSNDASLRLMASGVSQEDSTGGPSSTLSGSATSPNDDSTAHPAEAMDPAKPKDDHASHVATLGNASERTGLGRPPIEAGAGQKVAELLPLPPNLTDSAPLPPDLTDSSQSDHPSKKKQDAETRRVRAFVNDQSHTVNMVDPNASTPRPVYHPDNPGKHFWFDYGVRTTLTKANLGDSQAAWAKRPLSQGNIEIPPRIRRPGGRLSSSESESLSGSRGSRVRRGSSHRGRRLATDVSRGDTDSSSRSLSVRESVSYHQSTDEVQASADDPNLALPSNFVTLDGGHVVVTDNTARTVQGFGVLVVLQEDDETGNLTVRQVSENCTELLGLSPRYLFRLDCFSRILSPQQEDILRDNIDLIDTSPAVSSKEPLPGYKPVTFLLSGYGEPGSCVTTGSADGSDSHRRREWTCWVTAHRPPMRLTRKQNPNGVPNLIVLELEHQYDEYNPLSQPVVDDETSDETPKDKVQGPQTARAPSERSTSRQKPREPAAKAAPPDEATQSSEIADDVASIYTRHRDECYAQSTTNFAKPIKALERLYALSAGTASGGDNRTSRGQNHQSTEFLDALLVINQVTAQLNSAPDLASFLKITAGIMMDLCRFHRTLIFRFDPSWNGQVVGELVQKDVVSELLHGLNFPASDMPVALRDMFQTTRVRMLYDRCQPAARLVLRDKSDLDYPLDLTYSTLQVMPASYLKLLENMGVRSNLCLSILVSGRVWGFITCQSFGEHGMRVPVPIRQLLHVLSDTISRSMERFIYEDSLKSSRIFAPFSALQSGPLAAGFIMSNMDDMLSHFGADSGLLVIKHRVKLLGTVKQPQSMLAIAEYLRASKFPDTHVSCCVRQDFPDLILPSPDAVAGLLYIPLTEIPGQDFLALFRKDHEHTMLWAGNPQDASTPGMPLRTSFQVWPQTITGVAKPWKDEQIEAASILALIYSKFIQVWRERRDAMVSSQLTAILLTNTSHAIRTPLSQIINTLELALASGVDPDIKDMLETTHQASRALLFHVHDLLDITQIETGNETSFNDPFNVRDAIRDTVRIFRAESDRRGIDFKVTLDPNLPEMLVGDCRKIKTAISNLVANSVKFTSMGSIEVCARVQALTQVPQSDEVIKPAADGQEVAKPTARIEVTVGDTGCGMPPGQLEDMFITLEGAEDRSKGAGLGLGLAVVARIVDQLSGQLRVESEVGKGTTFSIVLDMEIYDTEVPESSSNPGIFGFDYKSLGTLPLGRRSGSVAKSMSSSSHSASSTSPLNSVTRSTDMADWRASSSLFGHRLSTVPNHAFDPLIPHKVPSNKPAYEPVGGKSVRSLDGQMRALHVRSAIQKDEVRSSKSGVREKEAPKSGHTIPPKTQPSARKARPPPLGTPLPSLESTVRPQLRVMVVEDDMINSKILQRRLRMEKHTVTAVENGQQCVDSLCSNWDIDVIIMDIQMPVMDGLTAASEIRKLEAELPAGGKDISPLRIDGRIPIFALSASLYERDRAGLTNFDGWLLKPLDFSRLRALLQALQDDEKRNREVYKRGHWERGGYFRGVSS